MGDGTIRIHPLEGFECTVDEFRWIVGDSGQPEHVPFPHDEQDDSVSLCAGDCLRYGPVLFQDGMALRIVTHIVEGDDRQRHCIAVYGRCEGPRRKLADGSWSVRVRPFANGDEYEAARQIRATIRAGSLAATVDIGRYPVMVIVRQEGQDDYWVNGCP